MTKIIMDCDPGIDDAIAIMLAGKNPAIEVMGISVVAGNQTLDKTTKNALGVCEFLGLDIPVYSGCPKPIVRENIETAEHIHGESGIDGIEFPPLKTHAQKQHSVLYIIDTLRNSNGDITLVPTGPLTNIAMAIRLAPDIIPKIKQIVLMGGSYSSGNITPAAEFNIYSDPEAAHIVFTSGCKIVMAGLDVTKKVLCYPSVIERMKKINNCASELFCKIITAYNKHEKDSYGIDGAPLHDPVTIAYIIDNSVLTTKHIHVDIDIHSEQSCGRTNCDIYGHLDKSPNAYVAIDIDVDKFWNIIESGIKNYTEELH